MMLALWMAVTLARPSRRAYSKAARAMRVESLRVFQYEYSYRDQGGHYFVGMEGGWDVRRMIGTVPVEEDGSAMFHIPANTPVSLQPLDEEGKAMQQMRSWLVGMPGEYVSCAGCPESH